MKKMLWNCASAVICLVFVMNALAYFFYWYARISWYDMLMHTLGGIFLALALGALFSKTMQHTTRIRTVVFLLLGVFIIGFGWEIFEYIVQGVIKGVDLADIPDSISDLCCDIVGGSIGVYLVNRIQSRYTAR